MALLHDLPAFSQELSLSPRTEFFSIPNSPINSEEISDIKVDHEGYVWVVSYKGLYRFDGDKFQKISANFNSYGSLIHFHQGSNGERFVIDYWGGLYFVDNDSLFEYKYNSTVRSYYKNYGYSDIFLDGEELHFAFTSSGYKVLKEGEITDPLKERNVVINGYGCQFKEGRQPFVFTGVRSKEEGRRSRTFYLFDDDFNQIDSLSLSMTFEYNHSSMTKLPNGNYLYSNGKGNLVEFNNKEIIGEIEYTDEILNLFVDNNNNLWISTKGEGIHFYENSMIDYEARSVVLPKTSCIVKAQDYQNGIWLYSQEKGIGYISHPEIKFYSQKSSIKPLVEALEVVDGKVIYADKNQLKSIVLEEDIEVEDILKIKEQIIRLSYDEEQQRLWISARGALYYLEKGKLHKIPDFKGKFTGSFSYFDSEWDDPNISLVATSGYQYYICKDTSITYSSPRFEYKLKSVILKEETVYINTGNGIYVESPDSNYYLGDIHEIARKSADQLMLFNNKIAFSIPSEGVYLFDGEKFEPINFNGEVIPSAKMIKQNDSTLWTVSNYGCFRITVKKKAKERERLKVEAFRSLPRMALKKAIIADNKLITQTRNSGIGIIELDRLVDGKLYTPELLIIRVETENELYYKNFNIKPIPYDENNLQLSFKTLDYHILDVKFRFKLNQVDDDWTATNTGFVNYVALSPGDYEFVVQSRFGLGDWSKSKKIKFKIVPPFWQRWWFILALSLFIIIITYQLINYRFRVINREKSLAIGRLTAEQKALRAKMDPHFMFNIIASVQYLILRKKNKQATVFLNQFSSLLRNTLNQTDSEYISISDEIKFLKEYIELEKMRLEDKFDYLITIEEEINKDQQIPTFIIQPFVENAIHHGLKSIIEQGELKIVFKKENAYLKISIEDNGIGYETSLESKKERRKHISHGIETIKNRLKMYNDKAKIDDIIIEDLRQFGNNNSGTRVTVLIKIKTV